MLAFALSALLAVLAGAGLVLQQILNANLRAGLDSASWAGVSSYAVGLACMALLAVALRDPAPAVSVAGRIPWWTWSGGLFGALFIGLAILLVRSSAPRPSSPFWSPARCSPRCCSIRSVCSAWRNGPSICPASSGSRS